MEIKLTKKEIRAIMSCVIITEDSIDNNVLMVRLYDKKMLKNVNLDDLYIKLSNQILNPLF